MAAVRQWQLVPARFAALVRQTLDPAAFGILIVDNGPPGEAPDPALPANARRLACAARSSRDA